MHPMTNGTPCGRPDGHQGQHRSLQSMERQRKYSRGFYHEWLKRNRERKREYNREYYVRRKQQAAGDSNSEGQ